jgi:hypothetical protein
MLTLLLRNGINSITGPCGKGRISSGSDSEVGRASNRTVILLPFVENLFDQDRDYHIIDPASELRRYGRIGARLPRSATLCVVQMSPGRLKVTGVLPSRFESVLCQESKVTKMTDDAGPLSSLLSSATHQAFRQCSWCRLTKE